MTNLYAQPRDSFAETAVIGCLMTLPTIPAELGIRSELFWEPHLQSIVIAILALSARNKPIDPLSVRAELLRSGVRSPLTAAPELHGIYSQACSAGSLTHHIQTLSTLAARRALIAHATRALQAAGDPSTDPYEASASLHVQTGALADSGDPARPEPVTDAHDFLAGTDAYDWLIPGLIERSDRILITGGEGSGKSVLSRQLAVTTAAGVHPFQGHAVEPRKVLLIDLENGERHLRRALRRLWDHATILGHPIARTMLTVESRPSGIDLTGVTDSAWLLRLCDTVRPDLLVIGPLYRMHARDMNAEEPARMLTQVIDKIRALHGCAIVMETHAPHGGSGMVRSLRPVGSSLFMRWPEFGYGLRPMEGQEDVMALVEWRGPRDEREFPSALARGGPGEWPWAAHNPFAQMTYSA